MLFYSPLSITPPQSPSFSFSHQANYILVTVETCLLNAFSSHFLTFPLPLLLSFLSSTYLSLCLLLPHTVVYWWTSVYSLISAPPFVVWGATSMSLVSNSDHFYRKYRIEDVWRTFKAIVGLLWSTCTCKQIKKAMFLLGHVPSMSIDCVSGPHWIRHSEMWAVRLSSFFLLVITGTMSNLLFCLTLLAFLLFCLFIHLSKLLSLFSLCSLSLPPSLSLMEMGIILQYSSGTDWGWHILTAIASHACSASSSSIIQLPT